MHGLGIQIAELRSAGMMFSHGQHDVFNPADDMSLASLTGAFP
jgi:hypothetical protein